MFVRHITASLTAVASYAVRDQFDDQNHRFLNFRDAARRVDRDLRTIKRWKHNGMPTVMLDGTNYVELDVLLAWWRQRLLNHPCMQRNRARIARERSGGQRAA